MAKQSYPYYMPSPRMTRTTPGSYEAPVEGIVDLTAFERGFQSGIAPGIKAVEEDAQLGVEAGKEFDKLDTSVKVFSGENKNVMTGGQDLITNDLFEVDARINTTSLRKEYIKAYKRNDTATMDSIVNQIGGKQKAYTGLALYTTNIGDNEKNDGAVSDTNFIDENKNKVNFNGADFTDLNNNRPKDIRQGSKISKDGILKQGFYVKKDGKEIFLNTEDIDEAYINRNFNLRYDIQDEVNKTIEKDGVTNKFDRTPKYRTETTGGTTITLSDGNEVNVSSKDVTKYIDSNWYAGAEANAEIAAQNIIANEDARESLWNQFTTELKNGTFKSDLGNLAGLESIRNVDLTDPKVASKIDDKVLTEGLKDYAKQKWLITVGNQGYVKGKDGRAVQVNDFVYSKSRTQTTRPESGRGGLNIDIGGGNFTRKDLLDRMRELVNRTGNRIDDEESIRGAIKQDVINVAGIGKVNIEDEMINISFGERGPAGVGPQDPATVKNQLPIIKINIPVEDQQGKLRTITGTYDLSTPEGIQDYMKAVYGTTTDQGREWSKLYEPTAKFVLSEVNQRPNLP